MSDILTTETKGKESNTEDSNNNKNTQNEIKLYDTWNNKYFFVKSGSSLRTYICGPTVYSESHIGHLKTYLSFDIIRRVLEDYFKIAITVMENITNVDDKIIKGTYQNFYGNQIIPDDYDLNKLDPSKYLDNQQFINYADKWEKKFFDVMDSMRIRRPNIVSRVTEYIQEVFEFVDVIDKRGFAFEDNGSVYFYGTKYNNIKSDDGSYSKDPKNIYNFSLLKKTKDFEPGWVYKTNNPNSFTTLQSVRLSWHIECSAMASSIYGYNFDIHAGGIDLKCIHHNAEMQQSNAIYKIDENDMDWVNHFLHMGHLGIDGLKMSRSLKNFITVPEMMQKYTHNEIRMLFLLHQWADPMDYSEETMKHAVFYVDLLKNFFLQTKSILLRTTTKRHKKFGSYEIKFFEYFEKVKLNVDSALRNNIDSPSVIKNLHELVSALFTYVTTVESSETYASEEIINDTKKYVKTMLDVFGLDDFDDNNNNSNEGKESQLLKVIQTIRTELRDCAKNIGTKVKPLDKALATELQQSIYKLTDMVRDKLLPDIGVSITDK
jgi:cysteinyl-tRNA synthetase